MKMLDFFTKKNGVEVKSDEEEIFKMEVDEYEKMLGI